MRTDNDSKIQQQLTEGDGTTLISMMQYVGNATIFWEMIVGKDNFVAESSLLFYPCLWRFGDDMTDDDMTINDKNDRWDDDSATGHRRIGRLFLPTPVTIRRLVLLEARLDEGTLVAKGN